MLSPFALPRFFLDALRQYWNTWAEEQPQLKVFFFFSLVIYIHPKKMSIPLSCTITQWDNYEQGILTFKSSERSVKTAAVWSTLDFQHFELPQKFTQLIQLKSSGSISWFSSLIYTSLGNEFIYKMYSKSSLSCSTDATVFPCYWRLKKWFGIKKKSKTPKHL